MEERQQQLTEEQRHQAFRGLVWFIVVVAIVVATMLSYGVAFGLYVLAAVLLLMLVTDRVGHEQRREKRDA